jgi:hypothetical protein
MEEYIEIQIRVETDGDFSLNFKNPKRCQYSLKREDGDYVFKLKYQQKEEIVKEELIKFLNGIKLDCHKDYLIESFNKGKEKLFASINDNIFNYHPNILGGGNWSFGVAGKRIWIGYK